MIVAYDPTMLCNNGFQAYYRVQVLAAKMEDRVRTRSYINV